MNPHAIAYLVSRNRAAVEAVRAEFEVTDSPKDSVRRMLVVNVVAERTGVKVINSRYIGFINRIVAAMGAEHIRPYNRRMWRKLRRRDK